MPTEFDDEGLPIVPELKAGEKSTPERDQLVVDRATKSRELRTNLRKENENLKKGLNPDGTEKKAPEAKKEEAKPGELDKSDMYLLRSEKITDEKEVALVKEFMKDTGRSLDKVLESKIFQAELKEMRDLKATEDATPEGKNRSGASAKDTVDYWISKGELPKNNPALRIKVVNAKIAAAKNVHQFSDNPIQ